MPVYFESRKNKRKTNQDYCLYIEYRINHEAMIKTMIVADGMGGLACGEEAATLAGEKWVLKLQKLTMSKNFLGKSLKDQMEQLKHFSYEVYQEINEEIYQYLYNQGVKGGTTLTAAIYYWDTLILSNCGDSPAYYYSEKKNQFLKLSKEHNAAEEMLREGKVTKESLEYWKHKNMLTDYLGKYRKAEPYVTTVLFEKGDCILIGSDGAYGKLNDESMKSAILKGCNRPNQIVKNILEAAEKQGEEDNQTLMCYLNEAEEERKEPKKEKRGFFRKRQAVK